MAPKLNRCSSKCGHKICIGSFTYHRLIPGNMADCHRAPTQDIPLCLVRNNSGLLPNRGAEGSPRVHQKPNPKCNDVFFKVSMQNHSRTSKTCFALGLECLWEDIQTRKKFQFGHCPNLGFFLPLPEFFCTIILHALTDNALECNSSEGGM